ncbi:MAG: 3-dehydroquinate synthase [Eubacteriaceae bacterium]|nr:3-dehydroquinate synthase [Eubacteriaceae bacterium]
MAADTFILDVEASSPCKVYIGEGILEGCADRLGGEPARKILAVCDGRVLSLWKEKLESFLGALDAEVTVFVMENAEHDKNMDTALRAVDVMASRSFGPDSCVMSVGGGSAGDLSGFVSDIYMRGVKLVHVPTSIIAMTDSCTGGKNALDHGGAKNLLGTLKQPYCVIADSSFLSTMPRRLLGEGYGEIIKYDVISGRDISMTEDMPLMIFECLSIKADFVREDEFDRGRRHILNFGHTFGHAFEALSGYEMSHGAAVGYGMKLICAWAASEGIASRSLYEHITAKLDMRGITGMPVFTEDEICSLIRFDKKNRAGGADLVVPRSPGDLFVMNVPFGDIPDLIREAYSWM